MKSNFNLKWTLIIIFSHCVTMSRQKYLEGYPLNYHQHDQDAYLTATKSTEIRLKMQGNISLIWIVN